MDDFKDLANVRRKLKKLWEDDQLINAVVVTDDAVQFRVHWELMVGVSPYISRMVESLLTTSVDAPLLKISVSNVTSDTMSRIINWAYKGALDMCPNKVESLLSAAYSLDISTIVNLCIKFLSSRISEKTCIDIYKFAKYFGCQQLFQESRKFILSHFEKIFPTSYDFLNLAFEDLESLLSSDELNVRSEEKTFRAILLWTEHDSEGRRQYLPNLLAFVRFGFCSVTFYQNEIMTNPMITESQDCQSVLYQASMLFIEMNGVPDEARPIDMHHPLIRPRIPDEIIFVIGGWSNGSATNVIETYDIRGCRWFISPFGDIMPRAYHGLISLDCIIYMIGGFDGNQCFNSVRCFNPTIHEWCEKACMYIPRCYVSVATANGIIYAMGGYDGHLRVNSAECYHRDTNQWSMISSMHQIRSDASSATLNGKIYVAGGFNGQQVLSSAEVYDPETDAWTLISEMSSPRSGVNLAVYNDTIFVMGGFNGNNRLNTVECYDARARQWVNVASMNVPRSNFATTTIENFLFVIGGFNGLTTVSSVECYNHRTNTWVTVADMNVNRSALAACVMKGLPNSQDYSFIGSQIRWRRCREGNSPA